MEKELKDALEAAQKAHADFKAANDAAEAERVKLGRLSAETQEKLDKIQAAVDERMAAAQKQWDDVERKINRGALFGGADSRVEAKALELKAFNGILAKMKHGGVERRPIGMEQYEAYKAGFRAYLRGGDAVLNQPEFRAALSVGADPDGGYAAPADITNRVVELIYETSPLRGLAAVRRTSRERIQIRRDLDQATLGGWVGETASRSTSATPQIPVPHDIPVHEQYAFPLVSQQELEDADFDVEGWLQRKVADRLARAENLAFVSGNGVGQPRGFTTYSSAVPAKGAFEKVEQVNTGAAASFKSDPNGPDIFIDLIGKMKEAYLSGRSLAWAMTRTTLAAARKLKDSNGMYQVQISQGLQGRPGFEILGFPIVRLQDMAELGAGNLPIAFANWEEAYQIVDHAAGLTVLRDPYTQKPNVGFYTRKRVGGDVANFEAIKLAKCSA